MGQLTGSGQARTRIHGAALGAPRQSLSACTRRQWLAISLPLLAEQTHVRVPVYLIFDARAGLSDHRKVSFLNGIWREARRDLERAGIILDVVEGPGEIERPLYQEPIVKGLVPGRLNVMVTRRIPVMWSRGRPWNGLTMLYRGFHLCLIALDRAQSHRVPVVGVNTCLHEVLHAIMGDIFLQNPSAMAAQQRELRIDWLATQLWLFGSSTTVRRAASAYSSRLAQDH